MTKVEIAAKSELAEIAAFYRECGKGGASAKLTQLWWSASRISWSGRFDSVARKRCSSFVGCTCTGLFRGEASARDSCRPAFHTWTRACRSACRMREVVPVIPIVTASA
jgi:hypothetical protein